MFSYIDILIFILILSIVSLYGFLRYREEKIKKKKNLIPSMLKLKEKWIKEKEAFSKKAEKLKEEIEKVKEEIERFKRNIGNHKWSEDDIESFKLMRGTSLQYYLSNVFLLKGFNVYDPPVYKDCNIDIFLEKDGKKICVSFADRVKIRKLDFSFLRKLKEGKEKYNCDEIWILTNSRIDKKLRSSKLLNMNWIVENLPPVSVVDEYEYLTTKLHNLELMYEETIHEVIRRNTWIEEIEEKVKREMQKSDLLSYNSSGFGEELSKGVISKDRNSL